MSILRAFGPPVAIVFGVLLAYGGIVTAVAASERPVYGSEFVDPDAEASGDSGSGDSASGDSGDGDEFTETPEPEIPETDTPPVSSGLPASCAAAFSDSMKTTVQGAGLVLNPAWSIGEPSYGLSITDASLRGTLAGLTQLKCRWLGPEGGGEVGIETTIAVVDATQGSAINTRLSSLGYTPLSELGGVRYVWERAATDTSDRYGESHIVVGGYWFATHWLSYGPTGYTADVVSTVLG